MPQMQEPTRGFISVPDATPWISIQDYRLMPFLLQSSNKNFYWSTSV